eukprot:7659268-Lingulodinium_polyedra.AAC.1
MIPPPRPFPRGLGSRGWVLPDACADAVMRRRNISCRRISARRRRRVIASASSLRLRRAIAS